MVSLETAKALRDAGLTWEPKYGDWYDHDKLSVNPQIVAIMNPLYTLNNLQKPYGGERFTWLPRIDQLLAEIERRGHDYRLTKSHGLYTIRQWQRHGSTDIPGKSPEEAAAKALLWILESEGE